MANIFTDNPYKINQSQQGVYQPNLAEVMAQKSFANPYQTTNTSFTADSLQNTQSPAPIANIQPQDNNNYQAILSGLSDQLNVIQQQALGLQQQQNQNQQTPASPYDQIPSWLKGYLDNQPEVPNPQDIYNQAQQGAGLDAKNQAVIQAQQALDLTNAELARVNAQAQQGILQLESQASGKDVTTQFLGRQQQEIGRQAAIQALPLQAQALAQQAVLTGNQSLLKAAQDRVDLNYKLQMDYANAQYQYKQRLIDAVYDYADKQEQRALDAKKIQDQREWETKQADIAFERDKILKSLTTTQTGITQGSNYQVQTNQRVLQSVDELLPKVNSNVVGFWGKLKANVPGTEAYNFKAELDTLKSNITFGALTAMREASKTGGALGQVSDTENKLLGATLGALDIGQTPENFKKQLQKIKDSINRFNNAVLSNGGNIQQGGQPTNNDPLGLGL